MVFYNSIDNINKLIVIVGIDIIIPYFTKSIKRYLILYFESKLVNIIPANAPIGVKKAPILEPIILAYTSAKVILGILAYRTLIGILFIKSHNKNDEYPYLNTAKLSPNVLQIIVVKPVTLNPSTITNIDNTNIINSYGNLFTELNKLVGLCLVNIDDIKLIMIKDSAQMNDIKYISILIYEDITKKIKQIIKCERPTIKLKLDSI